MHASHEYAAVHKAADYYEPLFRARFVRAMRAVRKSITINDIAMLISKRQMTAGLVIPPASLREVAKVVRDAVRQGGKIGAEKVRRL